MVPTRLLELLRDDDLVRDLVISALWIALVLGLRFAATRLVRRKDWSSERASLRWIVQVRRGSVILIALGLLLVWGTELRTMALSLTAIAVALLVATKEMLLCVMGSLLRTSSRSFTVGDRIEIAGVRGDVIDHGLFATTILEIGPMHLWTGRTLTVPNSLMLTHPVVNETFATDYVLHIITVPIDPAAFDDESVDKLEAIGADVCSDYLEDARKHLRSNASEHGFEPPVVEPRVSVRVPEAGKLDLLLRIPTPARDKDEVEQKILRGWLTSTGR